MKYKTLTILFLSVTLFGGCLNNRCSSGNPVCGVKDDPQEVLAVDSAFVTFVNSIPILRSGFTLKSEETFQHIDHESKFIPDGAALIGRLLPFRNHELIIYSYPADIRLPILEIYNLNGEKVNERQLFNYGACNLTDTVGHIARISETLEKIYLESCSRTTLSGRLKDTIVVNDLVPQ